MKSALNFCFSVLIRQNKLIISIIILSLLVSLIQVSGVLSIVPIVSIIIGDYSNLNDLPFLVKFLEQTNLINNFTYLLIFFLFLNIISSFLSVSYSLFSTWFSASLKIKFKKIFFNEYLKKKSSFLISYDKQKLSNIILSEIDKIESLINAFINIISYLIMLSIYLIIFYIIDKVLLGIFFIAGIFFFIIILLSKKSFKNRSQKIIKYSIDNQKVYQSILFAFREIIFFKIAKKIKDYFLVLETKILSENMRLHIANILPKFLSETFLISTIILIVIIQDPNSLLINLPIISFYFLATIRLLPNFLGLTRSINLFIAASQSYLEVNKIVKNLINEDDKKVKIDQNSIEKITNFRKSIRINKVKFQYENSKKIFNYNLNINKGDRIAITGVSGVGKSTFLHIIYGIFENYNGSIKIDGSNIKNDVEGYSNLFGYISQHNFVFNDSILENITFKKKLNTEEINKLKKIYEICGLDNVLGSFKQIYKKKITMDDTSISGGQKQRIIIARTLYKEPKILLLDEATSGLDLHSEYEILNNIIKSFKDITIISVSHRPIRKFFNKIYKIK